MVMHTRSLSLLAAALLAVPACKSEPSASADAADSAPAAQAGEGGEGGVDAKTPIKKTAVPDEGPLPKLRAGTAEVKTQPAIVVEMVAHAEDGAHYYEVTIPDSVRPQGGGGEIVRVHIESPASAVGVWNATPDDYQVMVRVPASVGAVESIRGIVYTGERDNGSAVHRATPFSAKGPAKNAADPKLADRWASAFAAERRGNSRPWWMRSPQHPWNSFAAGRVRSIVSGTTTGGAATVELGGRTRHTELSELMHTTTAATSMQEALQYDRGLRLRFDASPATVPIADLKGPGLIDHPWPEMTAALPDPKAGTPEPLARATPADFWYVRFDDIRMFLQVLDEADTWITPMAHIMEERAEVHDLAARYQAQLGLRRTGLAKKLGHTVVERVAIVGSDPYLREGSDVSFIFELNNQTVFDAELARHMSGYESEVPGIVESTLTHGEHTITVHRDPLGRVRQHRALVRDLAIVSNSEGAIREVLDAIDGKSRRLSDEPDLAYMLARDPGAHQGFAFLSDKFIANVVGAEQKVMASRRQRALAELLTPGYAALLYGWLEGKAPADTEALFASGLLDRDELRHAGGEAITFEPGASAHSSWGSPSALTPIIDLPALTTVTDAERDGYEAFARSYQSYWQRFIDPVAIRIDIEDTDDGAIAQVDVRVLPLISGTDYNDIEEIVGTERIEVPAIDDGLQMVWAVGAESSLRREIDRTASSLSGKADVGIGWLGDWVMVGSLDRRAVLDLVVEYDEDIQLPRPEVEGEERRDRDLAMAQKVGKLPVYAAAHVRNPTALIGALTAVRGMVNEVAPGMVQWGEHSRYRDYAIVRVGVDPKAPGEFSDFAEAIALYYVQAGESIVLALDPTVLETLVDRIVDGNGPKRGVDGGPQFVVEGRLDKDRASWLGAAWALQGQANRSQGASRAAAEILLRGDPSVTTAEQLQAFGTAYFGSYPVSASGSAEFSLTEHGVADPVHGSMIQPSFPQLPVAGSPIDALMQRLVGINASVAFDREPAKLDPPARSLHTHFRLHLGD